MSGDDYVSDVQELAKAGAKGLRKDAKDLIKTFGPRPWDSPKLTQTEQQEAFDEVAEDDAFWAEQVNLAGKGLKLSDGFGPRAVIEEAIAFEARRRGTPANEGGEHGYSRGDSGTRLPHLQASDDAEGAE